MQPPFGVLTSPLMASKKTSASTPKRDPNSAEDFEAFVDRKKGSGNLELKPAAKPKAKKK